MEEEERPRKIQKTGHEETAEHEELGPVMTGAVGVSEKEEEKEKDAATMEDAAGTSDEGSDEEEEEEEEEADGKEEGAATEGQGGSENPPPQENGGEPPKMSKNQLKKLRRKQQWEEKRELRKQKRKEKLAAKRARKRAALEEARQKNGEAAVEEVRKAWETPKQQHLRSTLLPITFVIDCDFDDLMNDKERVSLGAQLTRSYSDNYRAPYRGHLAITSFGGHLKERFDTVLRRTHENWKGVRFFQEDYLHAAELAKEWMKDPQRGGKMAGVFTDKTDAKPEDGEVVYLTSDSPYTLTELKPYSTYIIGGLVDKNRHKGICYKRATARGVKTAKLPIGEYIQMASRQVLATNHVVEIMLKWLELGDWGEAFIQVIPRRKGGTLKEDKRKEKEGEEGNEEEEEEEEEENDRDKESQDDSQPMDGVTADGQTADGPHTDHQAAEFN